MKKKEKKLDEHEEVWFKFWKSTGRSSDTIDYAFLPRWYAESSCERWAETHGGGFTYGYRYGYDEIEAPPLEWLEKEIKHITQAIENKKKLLESTEMYKEAVFEAKESDSFAALYREEVF